MSIVSRDGDLENVVATHGRQKGNALYRNIYYQLVIK